LGFSNKFSSVNYTPAKQQSGNTTVSLLALLDLQHNSLFLVFVILFSHTCLKSKKNSVVLLLTKIMGDKTTNLCDFTNAPNAQFIASPITSPEIKADSFEVSPGLLNLFAKDQFGCSASEDASMYLHDFCEICDMQKFKNVENDIVKLKLFPFSLRGKAKYWLLSLTNGSINSWDNLREAFIKKYYPLVKILQSRNNILSFKQNDNEHIATAWERLKIMLTFPSHGVNESMILHSFYNGLNCMSRSMLDSVAGGAFMTKTV
jgi:hypothetical protein